ncbi:integrator complex subunit 12 [Scaptodrosophila lebanonensis]|uniref:Integrator complex subunit 12 n=1 Tax=Drosophila lebanonensis TaxID=7225 RepID=A0A6J2SYB1_DROLE|nr:integrator complex subunit 12 [Scaptodrosophila lebanonensis]
MSANIAAAAAAAQEVDPVLKKAVKLLHSSNPTSAAELRLLLDEALKLRFGPEKLISNNLTQRMMEDETNFPGRATTPQPQQPILGSDEIINLTNSPDKPPSDSPDTIMDSDDGMSGAGVAITGVVNTGDTGDFGDLNCCVCGEIVFTANNRLIECSKCGALYHQDCHKPPITNEEAADDQEHNWQCDTCCDKPTTSKAALTCSAPTVIIPDEPMPLVSKSKSSVASSRSSNSSNSSSPFYKPEAGSSTNASSSSSSKHGHKTSSSSSSSKSHKEERVGKSVAPALSVISVPEKHTSSSSRRTSSTSNKTSSAKTSSSTSKHHESSSKRRSKQ